MLSVNVGQLLKSPVGTTRSLKVNDEVNLNSARSLVSGQLELIRTNRSILARGNFGSEVEMECCRCLNRFKCPVTVSLAEEFFPEIDVLSGIKLDKPEDPESFTINENHVLDITEALRQYILLAVPMKPLCRPDCRGINQE